MPKVDTYIDMTFPVDVLVKDGLIVLSWDGPDGDEQGGIEMHLDMQEALRFARGVLRWADRYGLK